MALLRAIFLWKNKEMFHVKRQYLFSGSAKKRFWPVYAGLSLSPRRLGTSLRVRGKLTIKEERSHDFKMYYLIVVLKRKAYET